MPTPCRVTLAVVAVLCCATVSTSFAQTDWTANLIFDPYPSPYLADWEANPNIGQAEVFNSTANTVRVRFIVTITRAGRGQIAEAESRVFEFPPGSSSNITTRDLIDYESVDYDKSIEDIAIRTGRLPEGQYEVCLRLEEESGTVLIDRICAQFTIVYPDPPYLIYPLNEEAVVNKYPIFQWTPVLVPAGRPVTYTLRIAEVMPQQTPAYALAANFPQYEMAGIGTTNLQYPFDALSFRKGMRYAWQVQVLDAEGFPPATNEGRSEVWTFLCDVDTTTPLDLRVLAGQVLDAETNQAIASARVVYRTAQRAVSDAGDTTWVKDNDSIVCESDASGNFKIDSALNQSFFSLEASKEGYQKQVLVGKDQYQNGDIRDYRIRMGLAPPGERRLAGILRDFYSDQPVPNATVVYHVVEPQISSDSSGARQINYIENPRKKLETITDDNGRFEFTQAADSSFFSLSASKPPSHLNAKDIGPNQHQSGDIENYILLIKPNASVITGTLKSLMSGKEKPVSKALVQLERTASATVHQEIWTNILGRRIRMFQRTYDTVMSAGPNITAYSDDGGAFRFPAVDQKLASSRLENPYVVVTRTVRSFYLRIRIDDERFQPYVTDTFSVAPGELLNTGEHWLNPKAGAIAGQVMSGGVAVEGARVYLYPPERWTRGGQTRPGGGAGQGTDRGSRGLDGIDEGGSNQPPDTGWGNNGGQPAPSEYLDMYQTDSSGYYAFAAVPINDPFQATDRYKIIVEADGFKQSTGASRLEAENEVDTVNFDLTPAGGIIFGNVSTSGGELISGVRVELRKAFVDPTGVIKIRIEELADWVETGGDGNYSFGELVPGSYRLKFFRTGYQELVTDSFEVAYGDRILRDVQLSAARGNIALTAKNKDGKGVSDVCVRSPQMPSLIGFTDSNGKLLVIDAVADSVTLQLRALGYADLDTTVLVRQNDTLAVDVKLAKSVGELLVRVVDKSDTLKRLMNIDVKLGKEDARTSDANGEVWFREAPAGKQKLQVAPPKSETFDRDYVVVETEVTIRPGPNPVPLTIELAPAARMSGTIKSTKDGKPVEKASVVLEGNSTVQTLSATDGTFELRNIPPGESVSLLARKSGFKSARFKYDKTLAAGDKITGLTIELEPSPMDSLFGFAVALDSATTGSGGHSRAWGAIIDIKPTFGVKLKDSTASLSFSNLEVDSAYRPVSDTVVLASSSVEIDIFGVDGQMTYSGGLRLEWVDSVKAGRITGDVIVKDPVSKLFPETKFIDFRIPKQYAPSFWAGGINRGLERFGLTATDKEVQLKLKSVRLGLDYTQTHIDTAGLHLYGSLQLGSKLTLKFEELLIGKNAEGAIALKAITIKTDPPIKIPFGVFTVVDSSTTWEATGFRASGAVILNALDNKQFGFKDLRISPEGEFLSLTLTADEANGTITVHGQKFQIEKLEFGTENFASDTLEHVKYFAFSGKLTVTKLDKPIELQNLKYTEKGDFTGKLAFNQSKTFGGIVTLTLESIEIGKDETKGGFIGISGGVKFGAVKGLNVQASNLRFYYNGSVTFDEIGMGFIAGPAEVQIRVRYADGVFEGNGLVEVKPIFSAGAEFRYGGATDWWVRIIVGTRIPMGPVELVQVSGGVGRKDDTWKFSLGGIIAPSRADKGIALDILVEVYKTPAGVIIYGNADVEVAGGTAIGRATIELNFPAKRVCGSIVFGYDKEALKATAQLDIGLQFGEYWYVYGRASISFLEFFKADGVIVVANNWEWQYKGQTRVMSGIYVELTSNFRIDANWYVIKWGVYFDRYAMVYIGWNGDFAGKVNMAGGAYAWIGFDLGLFSIDLIEARGNIALAAELSKTGPEWLARANGRFDLAGTIGYCPNAGCWRICWKCFIRIFGKCIFALPTGAKGCIGLNAQVEYSTSKGMDIDVSF